MSEDELPEGIIGFEPSEVDGVVKDYVCSVCHSNLLSLHLENSRMLIVFCPEHGNIEKCGRVMKSTVSIETERGFLKFREAVRNLSDLWPGLAEEGFEYEEAMSIRKHYVCKKCGGTLISQFVSNTSMLISLKCIKCRSDIEKDGYVRKGAFSNANL